MAKNKSEVVYQVIVHLSTGDICQFKYTNKKMAEQHFGQIKSAGTFLGTWVTKIELLT